MKVFSRTAFAPDLFSDCLVSTENWICIFSEPQFPHLWSESLSSFTFNLQSFYNKHVLLFSQWLLETGSRQNCEADSSFLVRVKIYTSLWLCLQTKPLLSSSPRFTWHTENFSVQSRFLASNAHACTWVLAWEHVCKHACIGPVAPGGRIPLQPQPVSLSLRSQTLPVAGPQFHPINERIELACLCGPSVQVVFHSRKNVPVWED